VNFVKLKYSCGSYDYAGASNTEMSILGLFLSSDVGCVSSSFREWAEDPSDTVTNSNITALAKEGSMVILYDLYSEEEDPAELKVTLEQFKKLLDDWQEKACKLRPSEIMIIYENDTYTFEVIN